MCYTSKRLHCEHVGAPPRQDAPHYRQFVFVCVCVRVSVCVCVCLFVSVALSQFLTKAKAPLRPRLPN